MVDGGDEFRMLKGRMDKEGMPDEEAEYKR